MDPTHRDRQDIYRFWHPQLNPTFRGRLEYLEVHRALRETGRTARQVLIQWARQVAPLFEPTSTPNPEEPHPDRQEDSPGSQANPKDLQTREGTVSHFKG